MISILLRNGFNQTLREANVKSKINNLPTEKIKEIINEMWSIKYEKKVFDYINYIHNRVKKPNNFDLTHVPIRINHNDFIFYPIL